MAQREIICKQTSVMSTNIEFKSGQAYVCGLTSTKIYKVEDLPLDHDLSDHCRVITEEPLVQSSNILRYFKIKKLDNDQIYIAQQKIKGTSLKELLKHGCPSYEVIKEMIVKILNGFQTIHNQGILHRDVSIQNIMVEFTFPVFTPKICGFNLYYPARNNTGKILSSDLSYLAPEVEDYHSYDIKSEIWAIGKLIYEILKSKFSNKLNEGMNIFRSKNNFNMANIPSDFRNTLQYMLSEDKANRPHSIADVIKLIYAESKISQT